MRRRLPDEPESTGGGLQEQIKAVAQEIAESQVVVSVADGEIKARALATGDITGLRISARAVQRYDNETLSELVLSAVRQVLEKAANAKLEAFRPIVGEPASFAEVLSGFGEGIAEEMKRDQENRA